MAISTRHFVQYILENANAFKWTIQGFGMLRTYIGKEHRLHVWDSRFSVPSVSVIHTHPWDFASQVIAGRLHNIRYERLMGQGNTHMEQTIKCGEGGGPCGTPKPEYLAVSCAEVITEGQWYVQTANEIHESRPEDGTVTLVRRVVKSDPDHASVFWPLGQQWVSAEPRLATAQEITEITTASLIKWF